MKTIFIIDFKNKVVTVHTDKENCYILDMKEFCQESPNIIEMILGEKNPFIKIESNVFMIEIEKEIGELYEQRKIKNK